MFSVRCSCCTSSDHLRAVCRKCYVHPAVLEKYLDGTLLRALEQRPEDEVVDALNALHPDETAVLSLIQSRLTEVAVKA